MDHLPLQTRTCLFTDIVGSTFLKASLDPRTARAVFMRSIEIFKECLPPKDVEYDDSALQREAAGRIVSDTGDGVFAVFVSALDAVETALKVQWRMSRETWPTEQPVTIRIGLDVGDTTTRPDAVHGIDQPFGTVTDSAARVMSLGAGGQILLTQGVSYLISNGLRRHPFHREGDDSLGDLRLQLESHGNYRFKGDRVAEGARPLEVFEVRPAALGPCSRPDASEKCWPCDDSGQAVTGWRPLPRLEVPGTHPDKWVLEQRIGVGGFGAAWLAHNRSNAKQKRVFKFCYDLARARSFRREKKLFDLLNQALEKAPNLRANIAAIERSSMEATSSEGGPDPLPPYWVQSQHYVQGNLLEWALSTYGTAEQQLTPEMTEEEQHGCLCKALALIPEKVRLALWVELARTTHAVHQHGIIHRDLKPTNIFIRLDQDGTPHPVLADFGIGMIDDFARLEAAGFSRGGFIGTEFDNNSSRTGTRLYTPPEALRGEKPTTSWDIYALGVLLYQFVRGDASLPMDFSWDQQVDDPVLRADIGRGVADVLQRWPSATDFAESVAERDERRRMMEEESARQQLRREQQKAKRRRTLIAVMLALALIAAMAGWYGLWKAQVAQQANDTNLRTLHEASMADYAVAVQRLEKDNLWQEGVARLARSLKWEPANALAATRLYATLAMYGADKHTIPRQLLRHKDSVVSVQFSPDATRIVTASDDNTAQVWDTASGKPLGEPLRHKDCVVSARFSPDGTRIVTASADQTARVWDAVSSKPLSNPLLHQDDVNSAQFSPDGSSIVTACDDNTARVWEAAGGKSMGEPLQHQKGVYSAQFSPDGTRIVTVSYDHTARIWDVASSRPLGALLRHEDGVVSAQFSPDGTRILTASLDKTARVWDAASGTPLGEPLRHDDRVNSAQFSPDGTRIVTASRDNTAQLWDLASGKPLSETLRHESEVNSAQFSPDGSRIVTAGGDKTARMWDAVSGKPLGELLLHEDSVLGTQFSPDGTLVVTASLDKTVLVWDAVSGKPQGEPLRHRATVWSAQFSPDGTRIVTRDKSARVWDAASGRLLSEPMRPGDDVRGTNLSPDGTRIVLASWNNTAQVLDAASRKPLGEPLRHEDDVNSAQFSPDSTRIVTAGKDKTARLWDAAPFLHPLTPVPEWMLQRARAVAGLEFDGDGQLHAIPPDQRMAIMCAPPPLTTALGPSSPAGSRNLPTNAR